MKMVKVHNVYLQLQKQFLLSTTNAKERTGTYGKLQVSWLTMGLRPIAEIVTRDLGYGWSALCEGFTKGILAHV